MSEMAKMVSRIRAFFRDRPELNRTKFAAQAELHRNTFYGMDTDGWNPRMDTVEKLLRAIAEYEAQEAKARRKTRPNVALALA